MIPSPPIKLYCHICKKEIIGRYISTVHSMPRFNYDCPSHIYSSVYLDETMDYLLKININESTNYYQLSSDCKTPYTRLRLYDKNNYMLADIMTLSIFSPLPIVNDHIEPQPLLDRLLKLKPFK